MSIFLSVEKAQKNPMPVEIERKFLLANDSWRQHSYKSQRMRQGYLTEAKAGASVRVRIGGKVDSTTDKGNAGEDQAWLNIKSAMVGASRLEYEYAIPVDEAEEMLDKLASRQIDKIRHWIEFAGHVWEVDEFFGDNEGLVVAEIELSAEDEHFALPEWAGAEVTQDVRYYNSVLAEQPYTTWPDKI